MSDTVHLKRGNKLWATSFMLPEHIEALHKLDFESQKVPKPELDEQELFEIGLVIMDSLKHELEIRLTYWQGGFYHEVIGIPDKVDYEETYVELITKDDKLTIKIDQLKAAERIL
ncbi:YolD-like family protein [Alkalihalobacillus pseudalcaliphilus]|uniref:YolD-like family protein n=1 Tax=Alkalihalobacillus pseudalcaliphilus TaxID=79884 RepID=UPI00069F3783|nr:YolD-like family protein [Alkalihalobacillus pseudalcaliphilus]